MRQVNGVEARVRPIMPYYVNLFALITLDLARMCPEMQQYYNLVERVVMVLDSSID